MAHEMAYTTEGNKPYTMPTGWEEVTGPELFKFEEIGDTLIAKLINLVIEKIESDGAKKDVLAATFEDQAGKLYKVFPPHDLKTKIAMRRFIGKRMFIIYDSNNAATAGKGNSMKVFKVLVEPDGAETQGEYLATDEDVPNF